MSSRATIRDLRTRFPKIKEMVEREGEVVVTDHGRPSYVLRVWTPPRPPPPVDYLARLRRILPEPLSPDETAALDDAERTER